VTIGTDTVLVRPHTLPADAPVSGVYAVGAVYLPSTDAKHECRECGCVSLSADVSSAAFVRAAGGPTEGDVLRSLAEWVRSRRPSRVVVLSESHRSVLRDRASMKDCLSGFIGNIEVLDGVPGDTPEEVLDAAGESFENPVLRGTRILYRDIDGVGEKVVQNAAGIEVNCVRSFCVREVHSLLRVLVTGAQGESITHFTTG